LINFKTKKYFYKKIIISLKCYFLLLKKKNETNLIHVGHDLPNTKHKYFCVEGGGVGFFSDSPGINKSEVIECKTKRNLREKNRKRGNVYIVTYRRHSKIKNK
jgi:hypothetical protein